MARFENDWLTPAATAVERRLLGYDDRRKMTRVAAAVEWPLGQLARQVGQVLFRKKDLIGNNLRIDVANSTE